jgi:hypothetical protein
VSEEEAKELSALIRGVLTYLYELPAKVRRSRGKK